MTNLNQSSEPKATAHTHNADAVLKKRRAFIKGSAAALPVVLTLRNGSAFAAVSISCLDKQKNLTPETIIYSQTKDKFVRERTVVRILTDTSTGLRTTTYEFPVGSGKWFPINVNSTNSQYFKQSIENKCGKSRNPYNVTNLMELNNMSCPKYSFTLGADMQGWILVQLDKQTLKPVTPLVVGPKDNHQTATIVATQSCLTSVV